MPTQRNQPYQLFGRLRDEEYEALKADIDKRGVQVAVELDENGDVLDGHHRKEIADTLGKTYKTVTRRFKTEAEKREHVIKLNLCRRHLEPWQWGEGFLQLLEERGVELGKGGDRRSKVKSTVDTVASVAKAVGVNVETAKKRVKAAKQKAALPKRVRKAVEAGKKKLTTAVRELRESKRETKRRENARKVATAASPEELGGLFSTILIDPPWDWSDEGDVNQLGRAKPDYATLTIEQLRKLPVENLAAEDCHLYCWVTNRSLPKVFGLIEAWGFRYVALLTWPKKSFGMGNYFRGQTEHIAFGVRGSLALKVKNASTLLPAWKRGSGHSAKPEGIHELIERWSPGPYLEMFARKQRSGWESWGEDG